MVGDEGGEVKIYAPKLPEFWGNNGQTRCTPDDYKRIKKQI